MRFDHLHHHLSRRSLLKAGAATTALAVAGTGGMGSLAGAAEGGAKRSGGGGGGKPGDYDDSFSTAGALDGSWARETTARYGADDQRGTLNEITPEKTACALALAQGDAVKTVIMAHVLRNGIAAYRAFPQRRYEQRITQLGYEPGDPSKWFSTTTPGLEGEDEWRAADRANGPLGYSQGVTPFGTNKLSGHEERFPEGGTYQIATQLDGLAHIGVQDVFYNGYKASEFATPEAVTKLGIEHVGPIVTRGVLLDVLSLKLAKSPGDTQMVEGRPMLAGTYRITIEDLQAAMKMGGIKKIEPGDVVVIRTGWNQLAELALEARGTDDFATLNDKYLNTEPGIYLREAKWLGDHRPAVVASDSWALEVLGVDFGDGFAFPVHNELITKRGIRIGESVVSDGIVEAGVSEFCYCYMPNHAYGATAGCTAPYALLKA
ncbi:MAG: cyclase family protein [Acidimicrobiia bacterium]